MTAESLSSLLASLPPAAPAPPTRPAPAGPWMLPLALAEAADEVEEADAPASVLAAACAASSAGAVKRRVLVTLTSLAVTI